MEEHNNIQVVPRQEDVSRFYNAASVVVNLSDKTRFIETFGLTALEAMAAGLPVIVPTVGGIAEMVEEGANGFKTDVSDLSAISAHIKALLSDEGLYRRLSENALASSKHYDASAMLERIISHVES